MPKSKKRVPSSLVDMLDLDLTRAYSLKEFEYISEQLKTRPIKVEGKLVYHFELDKAGKLVPMPQTPFYKEVVATEIARQLGNWAKAKRRGLVTASQGGFKIRNNHDIELKAPDVAFTPKDICRRLSSGQLWSFQGDPFSPTFVVEVDDFENIDGSKFRGIDSKFKDWYFAEGSSIQMGLLIDPKYYHIWSYKRNPDTNITRRMLSWQDVDLNDCLPGFTLCVDELDVEMDPVMLSTGSPRSSQSEEEQFYCVYSSCGKTFESAHVAAEHSLRDH